MFWVNPNVIAGALSQRKFHAFIILLTLLLQNCSREQRDAKSAARDIDVKGSVVPREKMEEPVIVQVDETTLARVKLGKTAVETANTNVIIAGKPKIFSVGTPKVCTPGVDSFKLPKVVRSIEHAFVAGKSEVVIAKDASIKDQNPDSFSSFNKLQGLTHSHVRSLLQDFKGNIWCGTYGGGATKFDGKYFTHFTESEGLIDNTVFSIAQDKDENLWFGTSAGATKYDGRLFTNYSEKEGLCKSDVYSIFQDRNGIIWFGTNHRGVFRYDGKSFTNFTTREGLSNNTVFGFLQDKEGNLWMATDGGGACKYDGKSFSHFTEKEGLSSNNLLQIFQDREERLWFATVGGGATVLDGQSFFHFTNEVGLGHNVVLSIQQDKNGDMWFGTDGAGLSKYNGKSFTHYTEKEGLSSNIVMAILLDINSNLWLGTFGGGLSKYQGGLFTHITDKEGLGNSKVWSILEDVNGNLWLGTYGGGVTKYDGKTFVQFTEESGLSNNHVASIKEDRKGNLWLGTIGGGASRFDGKFFTHFKADNGLNDNDVYCILEDKEGNLWFGTKNGGASRYDGKTFTQFTTQQGLSSNTIFYMIQDRKGNIWFATNAGLTEYDGKSFTHFTEREGMSSNTIMSLLEDQAGNLWFATYNKGITKYDGKHFTHFTMKDGLSSNAILSMVEDERGDLWLGTRLGLNKLIKSDGSDMHIKTFGYEDGFLGIGAIRNSICKSKTGTIWVGTTDRLTAYHSEGDALDTIPPNIQLTDIELFNEDINWGSLINKKDSVLVLGNGARISNYNFEKLTRWYNLPEALTLAYDNNYISFDYVAITQKQNKQVKYQYRLEGAEDNWSTLSYRTQATYSTLPHGQYNFRARAVNSSGYMSNEIHYALTIRPPWWKTWWFRSFYISALIVAPISFYFLRVASLRKHQKDLVLRVREATADLHEKSEELLRANKELQQFAYAASHDLQEPLRTISNYAELIQEENSSTLNPESTEYLQIVINAAHRLRSLIRDLLEFSKIGHKIKWSVINCNHVVKEVMVEMSIAINESGSKIHFSDLPVLTGNETELKRLFLNLISNAIKFRRENTLHEIEISAVENNTAHLFTIKDNGIGVDPKFKEKIFNVFQRADNSNRYSGTGIGLASCSKIVNQHYGKIWVESKPGEGSTFYFTIAKNIPMQN